VVCCGEDSVFLPEAVHGYLDSWLTERPRGHGPRLFLDRAGLRSVTAVDTMRLVTRCAARAGYGHTVTATQVGRAAQRLVQRGVPVDLPTLDELRRIAPAPEQLSLPEHPEDYDQDGGYGQQAMFALPENVVAIRRPRRRGRRRSHAV
jgi:hypothetical protein